MDENEQLSEDLPEELPEDFDIEENEDGSVTLVPPTSDEVITEDPEFYENLANKIDKAELDKIVSEYIDLVEEDSKAREKRDNAYAEALKRTGLGGDAPGGADFDGASKVVHPLITETAIQINANAIKELCPPDGPVKTRIIGRVTPEKLRKADRKRRHMNWQLTSQILEFKPYLEQAITQTAISGVQYTKMYYWERGKRPRFEYVPMEDIFVPYHAANFYSSPRKTHRQRLDRIEFEERVASGLYLSDADLEAYDSQFVNDQVKRESDKIEGKEHPTSYDEDGIRTVDEIYCFLKIEDRYVEGKYEFAPYILTIDGPTQKCIGLYRNWDPDQETYEPLDWIVEWSLIPWRGAYAIGLWQIIGGLSVAATGALRAILDSAHINNSATAIRLKGTQLSGQSLKVEIGEIKEIDSAPGVDDIRKIAMPLPFNPPSTMLYQVLGFLVQEAKGVVRTAIEQNPEYSPNMPVGTQMNNIEQGMKVYASIHSRFHDSMKMVLKILHRLNKNHLENDAPDLDDDELTDIEDTKSEQLAYRTDYQGEMDVEPVSDPNIFSEAQRFAQLQLVQAQAEKFPQIYDIRAINKRLLQLAKIPNIEEVLPEPPGIKDENPVSENIKMATGQPTGVLPDQDHLAHLQVHIDFMKDPVYGQNPAIKPALAQAWLSHVIQHMLMLYGSEMKDVIEQASGAKIKDLMDESSEVREALSKATAAASPQVLERTRGLLQQVVPLVSETLQYIQSIQPPTPQDPTAVAAQDVQIRAQLGQQKLQLDAQKLQVDQKKTEAQLNVDAAKEQNKAQIEQQKIAAKMEEAQLRASVELEKNEEDNLTAMTISGMKVAEGKKTGNIKNGNSLDQNFKNGGIVTKDGENQ